MKLTALIIAASAALAPMQAFASTGSDQAQVPNASFQVANSGDDSYNTCANGLLNLVNCNDIDIGLAVVL